MKSLTWIFDGTNFFHQITTWSRNMKPHKFIYWIILCFSGQNGKYLHFHDDGLSADAENPVPYFIELRDPTRICIKTAQGRYINTDKNGGIKIGDSAPERATKWEYWTQKIRQIARPCYFSHSVLISWFVFWGDVQCLWITLNMLIRSFKDYLTHLLKPRTCHQMGLWGTTV